MAFISKRFVSQRIFQLFAADHLIKLINFFIHFKLYFCPSVTETGSLTIVRRSNSRKGNLLPQSDHQSSDHQYDTETTIENFHYTGDFDTMQSSSLQSITKQDDVVTSDNVDLASDNLPAVDTPDACDKAALR